MASNKLPLVSILIPTYNRCDYLGPAIDSALAQTYKNIEIMIHDDASTDDTPKLLQKYKKFKNVRVIRTSKNHGMIGGWNYIASLAKGKYIKFLASDDLLRPKCVESLVNVMEKNDKATIATCKRDLIDSAGNVNSTLQFGDTDQIVSGKKHAHWILTTLRENKIGEPTSVMYRQSDIAKTAGFDASFSQFADFEYWLQLLQFGDIAYVNKSLCAFRVHEGSNTSQALRDGRFITETYSLIDKYYDNPKLVSVYNLSKKDEEKVKLTKTLDIGKNIKDLLLSGNVTQAKNYFIRLTRSVGLANITKTIVSRLYK